MNREIVHFGPGDIEIERFAADCIIHLFPHDDPHDAIEDILMGLYLLDLARHQGGNYDKAMKKEEHPNFLIMAFTEVKRINKKSLEEAQKWAFNFMEKIKDPKGV